MSTYGTHTGGNVYETTSAEDPQPTAWQKITHNRWVNLALLLLFLLVIAVVIACIVVISVFHKHLILQCGYAEFIALLGLVSLVVIFSVYHLAAIYKFFRRRASRSQHSGLAAVFDPILYTNLDDEHFKENTDEQEGEEYGEDEEEEEDEVEEESKATQVAIVIGKVLVTILAILGFLTIVVFTCVAVPLQQQTLAQWNGSLSLSFARAGKTNPLIFRESNGVVHIEADSDKDLYFAQGVATAQERMWQLEYNKRQVAGTLSAIIGASTLDQDKLAATLNLRGHAAADWNALDATTQANIQAYVDGINSFYDSKPTLAPEFYYLKIQEQGPSKFEPVDVLAIAKQYAWETASNGRLELLRYNLLQLGKTKQRVDQLIPQYDAKKFSTVLSAQDLNITLSQVEIDELEARQQNDSRYYQPAYFNGTIGLLTSELYNQFGKINSNNFVVSGQFTTSKKPILANDPHLKLTAPGQFHLVQLKNANVNAIGAALVGVPGVFVGRNDKISWGVTNSEIDAQDFYALEQVEGAPRSYKYKGTTYELKENPVTIKVAGQEDVKFSSWEASVPSTYGPIMNDVWGLPGVPVALSWTALRNDTSLASHLSVFRSSNWAEFKNSLSQAVTPLSYTYADVDGNIGFAVAGRVPVRQEGHSGRYVVKGDGSSDYLGFLSSQDLPAVLNPSKGYVISANNRITPPGYAHVLSQDWNGLYRAERIQEKLHNTTTLVTNDVKDIQRDVYSSLFVDLKPALELMKSNVTGDFQGWLDKVLKWNANEELYSQETSVFEMWFSQMGELVKEELGRRWDNALFIRNALFNGDPACAVLNKTCIEIASQYFGDAVSGLEGTYGSIPLWGSDVHEVEYSHNLLGGTVLKCLAGKTIVYIGGTNTVNEGPVEYPNLNSNYGVAYRQVVDFEKDAFIVPLGQSGNFLSPGYDDLMNAWKNGDYLDMKREGYQEIKLELSPK